MAAGVSLLADCDPIQRKCMEQHFSSYINFSLYIIKRLYVWGDVEQQVSMDFIELSPFWSEATKPALPAIPSLIVGLAKAISPAIAKPKDTLVCIFVLRVLEVVE